MAVRYHNIQCLIFIETLLIVKSAIIIITYVLSATLSSGHKKILHSFSFLERCRYYNFFCTLYCIFLHALYFPGFRLIVRSYMCQFCDFLYTLQHPDCFFARSEIVSASNMSSLIPSFTLCALAHVPVVSFFALYGAPVLSLVYSSALPFSPCAFFLFTVFFFVFFSPVS